MPAVRSWRTAHESEWTIGQLRLGTRHRPGQRVSGTAALADAASQIMLRRPHHPRGGSVALPPGRRVLDRVRWPARRPRRCTHPASGQPGRPPAAERGATPNRHPAAFRGPLLIQSRPMRWALPLLIIVVFVAAIVASLLPNPKATAEGCPGFCPNLGLDLVGGLRGEYQVIATDNQPVTPDILNQTRAIIETRVNSTGVSEPNVQTAGRQPHHGGAARRGRRRRDPEARGHHRPARLRGRARASTRTPSSRGRPLPAGMDPTPIFSGDQISAARRASTRDRPAGGGHRAQGAPAPTCSTTTPRTTSGEQFAIVLDGKVVSAPEHQRAATSAAGPDQSAASPPAEMNDLVTVLKFGALPLEIKEVGFSRPERRRWARTSCTRASSPASSASASCSRSCSSTTGCRASSPASPWCSTRSSTRPLPAIPVTLTLAGIAGFVLSVGMAVDANILIFERTKEELRAGKPLNAGHRGGLQPGLELDLRLQRVDASSPRSSCGTSAAPPVRGFALVLIIGVLTSMFTAVTLSRMMLRWVVRQQWARKASLLRRPRGRVRGHRSRRAARGEVALRV